MHCGRRRIDLVNSLIVYEDQSPVLVRGVVELLFQFKSSLLALCASKVAGLRKVLYALGVKILLGLVISLEVLPFDELVVVAGTFLFVLF